MIDATFDKINKLVPSKWQWVLNHDGFRRYFKNTGWMFFGQMFSLLVSFFIGAWLARYLGPKNYGVFNYAIAFAGLFAFVAPLGVDAILNHDLVANPEKSNELMGTAFSLKLFGGFLAFLLASIFVYFLEADYLIKLIVVIFSFSFVFMSFNSIAIFFNANVESKKNVKVLITTTFFISILKIILIIGNFGIIWLAAIYLMEVFLQAIGYLFIYKKNKFYIKDWYFDKTLAFNILKKSWLLMLASAAAFIYLKIDQVMIGRMMGATEVGLYAAAVKMADVWYFIPSIICSSLFPAIINAKKNSDELYRHRLNNLYWFMFILSAAIALPISFLSKTLMLFIFGSSYVAAASVLSIYIWAGVGIFLGTAINQYLMSEDMLKAIFILNLSTMIINIILNLYLIPLIGLNGAAIATLISYSITPIIILVFNKFIKNKKMIWA